jgi:hypothetical protein
MSGNRKPAGGNAGESTDTTGTRTSGEGAGSALEAMLKKRQMRVDPTQDPGASPAAPQQGDSESRRGPDK